MSLSDRFPDYFPYNDWKRNVKRMTDEKLLDVLWDFNHANNIGSLTPAVQRVMDHGGDLDEEFQRVKDEAWMRGLTVAA